MSNENAKDFDTFEKYLSNNSNWAFFNHHSDPMTRRKYINYAMKEYFEIQLRKSGIKVEGKSLEQLKKMMEN
jgi:hypothetical protein